MTMLSHDEIRKLKQDIVFQTTLCELPFTFHSTWGIFSPREIDEGTYLLLKHMQVNASDDCFDLGCGYGPIGLSLARLAPQGRTLLADKDYLACEYARKNAAINHISNADVILSNGFSEVGQRRFDVVASNIPAKVGKELLQIILHDAYHHLKPNGQLYVVTINGLREFMKRNFNEVFGNYEKVKQGSQYTVSLARKI